MDCPRPSICVIASDHDRSRSFRGLLIFDVDLVARASKAGLSDNLIVCLDGYGAACHAGLVAATDRAW